LKAKHETEKIKFEEEIKNIQNKLKEKDETVAEVNSQMNVRNASNPITILKRRLAKITATNIQKRKLIDQYTRNVKVIQDAFDQIREQTGIQSVEEIVTTFVKAEEQNYSLYNYVNRLNLETDHLEEENESFNSEIEEFKQSLEMSEEDKLQFIKNLENKKNSMLEEIRRSENEKDELQEMLDGIFQGCKEIVGLFKKCRFFLLVASEHDYDQTTGFTEQNVTSFLGEIEEYISLLIV